MHSLHEIESVPAPDAAKQELDALLTRMVKLGGSDLHITAGIAPCARVNGALEPLPGLHRLIDADTEALVRSALSEEQWKQFEADRNSTSPTRCPA